MQERNALFKELAGLGLYVSNESGITEREVKIDPTDERIDVRAKFSLQRMLKQGGQAALDAEGMVTAINTGQLAGIYGDDLAKSANIAKQLGTQRWLLVPKEKDAELVKVPAESPNIVFRDGIEKDKNKIDLALRSAWTSFSHTPPVFTKYLPPFTNAPVGILPLVYFPNNILNIKPVSHSNKCNESITSAASFKDFISLIRRSEALLNSCQINNIEERLHRLTGLYYGTEWSNDFEVEHSIERNTAFQIYLAKSFSISDNPSSCIGCGLFKSLKTSADVKGVDMGHVIIGLSSRMRSLSRSMNIYGGSSGLETNTWVGDLGGATGRLAHDRVSLPKTSAKKYFLKNGKNYGAPSNLEGDIASYVIGSSSTDTSVTEPSFRSSSIADTLEDFFVTGVGRATRCQLFLQMLGGVFKGNKLTNRSTIKESMAMKFTTFGPPYLLLFLKKRNKLEIDKFGKAGLIMNDAAKDIAEEFLNWLENCIAKP